MGNWKKVLDDSQFHFNGRSSVDLKDRFRTCFPKEYKKANGRGSEDDSDAALQLRAAAADAVNQSQPRTPKAPDSDKGKRKATKTEIHHAEVLEKLGIGRTFPKVQRRERREFTTDEDTRLLQGFQIVGSQFLRFQGMILTVNSMELLGRRYKMIRPYSWVIAEARTSVIGIYP